MRFHEVRAGLTKRSSEGYEVIRHQLVTGSSGMGIKRGPTMAERSFSSLSTLYPNLLGPLIPSPLQGPNSVQLASLAHRSLAPSSLIQSRALNSTTLLYISTSYLHHAFYTNNDGSLSSHPSTFCPRQITLQSPPTPSNTTFPRCCLATSGRLKRQHISGAFLDFGKLRREHCW